jgi:hypothetical protein
MRNSGNSSSVSGLESKESASAYKEAKIYQAGAYA